MSETEAVTVYTKPNCTMCVATKRFLTGKGVLFAEQPLTEEVADEARELGIASAPVVTWGTKVWGGFNPDKLKEIVNAV